MSLLPEVPADAEAIRRSAEEPGAFTVVFDRHFEAIHHYAQRRLGIDLARRCRRRGLCARGLAVAMRDEVNRVRDVLIFDPATSALLGEETTVLPGNSFHYPPGTVVGYSTYLKSAVVDAIKQRP